ncbi:MAG: hypothetical protein AB1505_18930 [Candidatus Latescibacterota bacterium]
MEDIRPHMDRLLGELVAKGCVRSSWIGEAIRAVPRHLFVRRYFQWVNGEAQMVEPDPQHPTEEHLRTLYSDTGLILRLDPHSAASQPSLIAGMLSDL